MDLVFILILAVILCLSNKEKQTEEDVILEEFDYTVLHRETKLNPQFYDDSKAFRRIVDELGFH